MTSRPPFEQRALRMLTDAKTFGRWFALPSYQPWLAVLSALLGIVPTSEEAQATIRRLTGRTTCPTVPARTGVFVVGRGGGKSFVAAVVLVLWAVRDYTAHLAPGERAVVMLLAADRKQAQVVLRYVRGILKTFAIFESMIEREVADGIDLTNGVSIEIATASYKSLRGRRVVCAIADELAWWEHEGANPDAEILRALRPALARTPGSLLLLISSPHARRGELWRLYHEHFGKDDAGDVLVIQAATRDLNPTFDQAEIDRAYRDDPQAAAAEHGALFRTDLEQYIRAEVLDAVTVPDRVGLPPSPGIWYQAFVDPSGGASDSMTLAIGHVDRESQKVVVDWLDEVRAPFDPRVAVAQFAEVLKRYGVREVVGDAYGGDWPASEFQTRRISYRRAEKNKSEIYREALPAFTSGRIEILDDQSLRKQLLSLERRTTGGGREIVDHPPRQKDDLANSVCGLLVLLEVRGRRTMGVGWVGEEEIAMARIKAGLMQPRSRQEQRMQLAHHAEQDRQRAAKQADVAAQILAIERKADGRPREHEFDQTGAE